MNRVESLDTRAARRKEAKAKDSNKTSALKRFIIFGVLISIVIVGWHLYENNYMSNESAGSELEDEIRNLTQALFVEEANHYGLVGDKFHVNIQGKTNSHEKMDRAALPLLQLDDDFYAIGNSSTIGLLKSLFDNYILDVHLPEVFSEERAKEEAAFLKAILETPVMRKSMQFLSEKGAVGKSYKSQLNVLKQLWFEQYARNKAGIGSSGFEHVFLAEIKYGKVLGLHNWIYFAEEEKHGNIDYLGYLDVKSLGKKNLFLLSFRNKFHGKLKPLNSLLIGTSPEFEMSLYTVCFLLQSNKPCSVQVGRAQFNIMTYSWNAQGKQYIASAFPAART